MRPLTDRLPKPLVEVAGRTLIDRALDRLQEVACQRAVVNLSYKAEMIEAHLTARTEPAIILSHEAQPLETGGGIAHALPLLGAAPFYALNADVILVNGPREAALERLADAFDAEVMDALLLLHPVARAVGYDGPGDFSLHESGCVVRRGVAARAPYVFTGAQILHPRLFDGCPQGAFSLNRLYDRMRDESGMLPRIHGLIHDGDWLHVGDLAGLAAAQAWFAG